MSSIVVQRLTKRFGSRCAIQDVSFEINHPGLIGLIGPNGAGKSTILRMLTTYLRPTSGEIRVAGFDACNQALQIREQIGYLPENPAGWFEARVEEFLRYRAQLKGVSRPNLAAEVDRCLQASQLSDVRRRFIGRLSLGFRRRVGLADALIGNPSVYLLDEPTIGLDPLQIRETRRILTEISRKAVVVVSTHLLGEAQEMCDRVLMLNSGRLVADIRRDELAAAGRSLEDQFVLLASTQRGAA